MLPYTLELVKLYLRLPSTLQQLQILKAVGVGLVLLIGAVLIRVLIETMLGEQPGGNYTRKTTNSRPYVSPWEGFYSSPSAQQLRDPNVDPKDRIKIINEYKRKRKTQLEDNFEDNA